MNYRPIEGQIEGQGKRFAIVVSRFNSLITERLLEGALDCLRRHGTAAESITVARVPGAWEIPFAAQRLARAHNYDAIICLGAVIRGATPHFDYVAAEVSKGVATISLQQDVPVVFGVLTTNSVDEAIDRAGTKSGNKGWDAAMTALEMAALAAELPSAGR